MSAKVGERPGSALRVSLAWLAVVWCGGVLAGQLTPFEAGSNPSLVKPKGPVSAPAARAAEQPTIRIVDPPDGATRTPGNLRVRVVAGHADLARRVTVSLTWANGGGWFGLPAPATQLTQTVTLQQLVAGWIPPRDFVASVPTGVALSLEVFGDPGVVRDHASEGLLESEYERSVPGLRAQATIRLAETDPAQATQRGGSVTSATPSPAAVQSSGRASGVQAAATQAPSRAPTPTTAAIRATGQSGARIRIVEPAAGSTTTPASTRLRVDYALHSASELAEVELAWQDYTSKTGPMQTSLLTGEGSKTWQMSFGQLAAGFVVPADKICTCTNGRATLKVRPAGTHAWQDEVAFNVVAAAASGTMSSPKAWSQATTPPATDANAARSTLLTSPSARAPLTTQAPASSFQRP